jgi:IMP dehydrogenase
MKYNNSYGNNVAMTYDDVCLVPQYSTIKSRDNVSLEGGSLQLKIPFISANMDSVTESTMAYSMYKNGGLGIIHRFMSLDKLKQEIDAFYKNVPNAYENLCLSVGVSEKSYQSLDFLLEKAKNICIDIAHGHSDHVINMVKTIRRKNSRTIIIAGNVATPLATKQLAEAGAHVIKVGIGPGAMCTTRVVTGHGIPQLSAIDACTKTALPYGVEIIADGGIRNSGDIAKALAAGANYVMLGSLLAGTDEAPGKVIFIDEKPYKEYRGMASFNAQKAIGKDETRIVPEGASMLKKCKGPVSEILFQLAGGLRSALSYSGSHNLDEFRNKAQFIRITSASRVEGEPHGLVER